MKRAILFVFILGLFSGIKAQDFSIRYINSSASGPASSFELVAKAVLTNNSNDSVFTWVRYKMALPSNWQSAICDIITCWDVTVDSNRFILHKGDSANIDLHVYPFNTAGSGSADILIYPNNSRSLGKIAAFTLNTWGTSTREVSRTFSEVELFPIPASKSLTIKFSEFQQTNVIIYDVLGKEVLKAQISGKEAVLDVSALENGIYVLRYRNSSGNYVSKKFRKASF